MGTQEGGHTVTAAHHPGSRFDSPFVEAAFDLAPLLEAQRAETSAKGNISPTIIAAFKDAGLFWMQMTPELGGGGASSADTITTVEELARADGSAGWSLMATMAAITSASGFLPDAGVEKMFGAGQNATEKAIVAGQLAPRGKATLREDGSLLVNGQYGFASGSVAANWMTGGVMVMNGDQRATIDGRPDARVAFLPKANVEMQGNWDVLGLEGTGSVDYRFVDVEIAPELCFPLIKPPPQRAGRCYRFGIYGVGALGHGAVALGLAKRALQEIAEVAVTKVRLGQEGIGTQQHFLHEFGKNDAMLLAARALLFDVYCHAEHTIGETGALPVLGQQRLRQAVTYTTSVAAEVIRFAYTTGGSNSLRVPSVLGDCLRHVSAATQHIFVDPTSTVDAARVILDSITEPAER